jgi:hypothetical protein
MHLNKVNHKWDKNELLKESILQGICSDSQVLKWGAVLLMCERKTDI